MVEDLKKWQNLIDKHDSLVWKLERSKVSDLGNSSVSTWRFQALNKTMYKIIICKLFLINFVQVK